MQRLNVKVGILRALHLGDFLCTIPALRALRTSQPNAHITWLGLPWSADLVYRFPRYLDDYMIFPGYPGLPERTPDIRQLPSFLTGIQARHFDWFFQLHGSGSIVNPLIQVFDAERSAGFFVPGEFCPDPDTYIPYPENEPELWRMLHVMEHVGIPSQGTQLEFPLYEDDWKQCDELLLDYQLEAGRYICIHPGARAANRRWSSGAFAALGDAVSRLGYRVVLTGTAEEHALTDAVAQRMRARPTDISGITSLGALAACLARSRMLICNDTGVSHIADALQTPSVVVFLASDPARWAPLDHNLHRVVFQPDATSVDMAMTEVLALLEQERVYADVH